MGPRIIGLPSLVILFIRFGYRLLDSCCKSAAVLVNWWNFNWKFFNFLREHNHADNNSNHCIDRLPRLGTELLLIDRSHMIAALQQASNPTQRILSFGCCVINHCGYYSPPLSVLHIVCKYSMQIWIFCLHISSFQIICNPSYEFMAIVSVKSSDWILIFIAFHRHNSAFIWFAAHIIGKLFICAHCRSFTSVVV